jgi:hypothetical protein
VDRAVALSSWIGTSRRPVTAGQVLRKADVPAAGAALGVDVPSRLRTMADIGALHRPWCVAVATGLLRLGGGWVTGGPALEGWPPDDADLLAGWLTGLRAVCAAESYPQDEDSVRLLAMALLTVLGKDGVPRKAGLWEPVDAALRDLCDRYDKASWADWEHEITLEQTISRDPGQDYPVCVEWRGDSPVEYWSEDDPEEPEPFSLAEVNRQLAALGGAEE